MITLYDLAGADDRLRFSPFCFRVKLALLIKGLAYRVERVRFVDKDKLAFSGQGLVPVLVDDDLVISDSWKILQHLDQHYPASPQLGADRASASLDFLRFWCDRALHAAIFRIAAPFVHAQLTPEDQTYFRSTREARLGKTLEAIAAERPQHVAHLQLMLEPLRGLLSTHAFIDGAAPGLGDVVIYSAWLWAEAAVPFALREPNDPIAAWLDRVRQQWPLSAINV
jgi:glutathione S-transferase